MNIVNKKGNIHAVDFSNVVIETSNKHTICCIPDQLVYDNKCEIYTWNLNSESIFYS